MEKAALRPSQNLGGSGGSRTYHRKRATHHYCAPSSVLLTVDDCTDSHAPVFVASSKQRTAWTGALYRASASAYSDHKVFLFLTYSLPYFM